MLLCGMKSGWPTDYTDLLKVRWESQLVEIGDIYDPLPDGWEAISDFFSTVTQKLPEHLQTTAKTLLSEFYALRPVPSNTTGLRTSPEKELLFPLYHDTDPAAGKQDNPLWRDQWNSTQAFFPLFCEWEMEYFHIDAEDWVLAPRKAYGPPKLLANIKDSVDISNVTNTQTITGRSLVLPQTTSMLKNTVEQLVKNKSTKPEDMDAIHAAINRLEFLTMGLSDLSSHLTTRVRGEYIITIFFR